MGSGRLMVRAPDSRLGGLWFSSTHFKAWTISFTSLCLCLSEETLKTVVPFSMVSTPMEVKYPTQGRWKWNRSVVDSLTIKKENRCYRNLRSGCFQLNVFSQCQKKKLRITVLHLDRPPYLRGELGPYRMRLGT